MAMTKLGRGSKIRRRTRRRSRGRVISRRVRRITVVGLLVIVLGLILSQRLGVWGALPGDDYKRYDGKIFRVVKVVDGDTLDIDIADVKNNKPTTRIRLWGVDTPETRHPRLGVMYFGPEASDFAKSVALDKDVTIQLEPFQESRGKYGRLLGYVYLPGGKMLNEELIEQGYGYADERFRHILKDKFGQLQKEAQGQKVGLWKNVQADQWPEWYRKRHDENYGPREKKSQ